MWRMSKAEWIEPRLTKSDILHMLIISRAMNGKSICSETDREESSLAGSDSQRKKIEVHPGARGWEKRFDNDEISKYLNPACSRYPALREGEGPLSRVEPRIISSLRIETGLSAFIVLTIVMF